MVSKAEERKVLNRELKILDSMEKRSSYKPPNSYKTAFFTIIGTSLIGILLMFAWDIGHKSKRDSCKCVY